jgi:hypothetical protein
MCAMNLSAFQLSRSLRLALLLLMLASQGIANAHALGDQHLLESDTCATCVIGHGLGAALGASHEAPPVQVWRATQTLQATLSARVARTTCHFARAPPGSFWNTPNPN